MITDKSRFKYLTRDSDFFGFPVVSIYDQSTEDLKIALKKMFSEGIKLGYFSTSSILSEDFTSNYYDFKLVEENLELFHPINPNCNFHNKVEFFEDRIPTPELIQLAKLAGQSTRFKKDTNISDEKYNELFENWIRKSVTKEMATFVLVYKELERIVGFATVKLTQSLPIISFLAVSPEFEGRGISFALLRSVDNLLYKKGYEKLKGTAQSENIKALSVYKRNNIIIGERNFVYHLWKKEI